MLKKNQSPLLRALSTAAITTAMLGLLSGYASAATADKTMEAEGSGARSFLAFDKNQDGFIDAKEASANPMLLESFDAVDIDRDGVLSMEEFNKGFATR